MKAIAKILTSVIAAVLAILPAGAAKNHYEINIGEFHILNVSDNMNVVWKASKDSAGYVTFYGDDRFADAFIFQNNTGKGTLKLRVTTDNVDDPELPTLYIYSSYITSVKSSSELCVSLYDIPSTPSLKFSLIGNGDIKASDINATDVNANIATGNGSITLQGKCLSAKYTMVGTGEIRADELEATTVNCNIMGTGSIFTWPVNSLKVKGLGSTKIYYRGNPDHISKQGGGKLMRLSDDTVETPARPAATAPAATYSTESTQEEEPAYDEEEEEEEEIEIPERRYH